MFREMRNYLLRCDPRLLPGLVLIVGSLNVIFVGGKRRTFAVFITAIHNTYNETTQHELNWIGDSYTGVAFMLMPIVTNCIIQMDRAYQKGMALASVLIGVSCFCSSFISTPRLLFLTHTILHGLGSSLVLSCTALVVGEYFDKTHRFHVLATTLISGGPYGALIFGPIYGNLVEAYGWRIAFRVIGATFVVEVALGALFYFPKHCDYSELSMESGGEINISPLEDKDPQTVSPNNTTTVKTDFNPHEMDSLKKRSIYTVIPRSHLNENKQIYLWMMERVIHNIVLYSLMMNLVELMTNTNEMSLSQSTIINLLFGVGESITFTFGVFFGDRIRGKLTVVYCLSTLIAAALLLGAAYSFDRVGIILSLTIFLGMTVGVGNTCVYATSEEVMRIHGSVGFPSTKMMAGVGLFLAPFFSGRIIDIHGYNGFFICQCLLTSLRFVLLSLILFMLHRKDKSQQAVQGDQSNLPQRDHVITSNNNSVNNRFHDAYGLDEDVKISYATNFNAQGGVLRFADDGVGQPTV